MIKNLTVLLLIFVLACKSPGVSEPELMKEAVPVWAEGRETEMNLTLGFQGVFQAEERSNYPVCRYRSGRMFRRRSG
ncbi:MAG: hypothetical protein K0B11_20210 [Mariniphaga sp.]|nr:hypothetical protein [Mariniphaga sp.]